MKRPPAIAEVLNQLLATEFSAAMQYAAHQHWASVAEYPKLAAIFAEHATQERGHAEKLIERIYQIEENAVVDQLGPINIGVSVPDKLRFDLAAEETAIADYNAAIAVCVANGDNDTRALLETILHDEEHHASELTALLAQIEAMTLANWLSTMT